MQLLVSALFALAALYSNHGYVQAQTRGPSTRPSTFAAEDESETYLEINEPQTGETQLINRDHPLQGSPQSFYPSFPSFENQPLGHSRPFFFQQERAYSQKSTPDFNTQFNFDPPARFSGYKGDATFRAKSDVSATNTHDNILGSGNFGVIKGGTFFAEGGGSARYKNNNYNPYYQNGHGGPSYYFGGSNPKAKQHEQFANFRDFADINSPGGSAYSEYVVVYANRNESKEKPEIRNKPKNIIESLALLDLESSTATTTSEVPTKKLSASKRKLAALPPEKKHKTVKERNSEQNSQELSEPLLALY